MNRKHLIAVGLAALVLVPSLILSGDLGLFFNPAGLMLVLGGTLAGVYLAYPKDILRGAWQQVRSLYRAKVMEHQELVDLFVGLARVRRMEGVRALEAQAQATGNPFLAMGVSLVADDKPPQEIRQRLEQEFDFLLSRRESERAVLNLMGRLAPAFGLAGTVVGLIRMLHALKDPSSVASAMSVALLTTFYGIMVANLMVLPLERKLRERNRAEAVELTLLTEGIMGLAAGDNGAAMAARLSSYRFAQAAPASAPAPGREARPEQGPEVDAWGRAAGAVKSLHLPFLSPRSASHER